MNLESYEMNKEATRAAVEKYLLQGREYKVTAYIPEEAAVTAAYSGMLRSVTNRISDQTGRIAASNVDEPERRRKHIARMERAIDQLGERQQKLIRARYLEEDDVLDFDVAMDLGYSDRHYRRIKAAAIVRLAAILGLIVLKE
ncbi:hypothetical protein EBB07_01415 [Paenibacillaceae bacterium]|nr:hypothetical protein EBB07_01415 [Paenibacillaceae bacterium]